MLDANSKSAVGTGGQKSVDNVIERLKIEAAKLGANGVILEGFSDSKTGSVGTGVGSDSYWKQKPLGRRRGLGRISRYLQKDRSWGRHLCNSGSDRAFELMVSG